MWESTSCWGFHTPMCYWKKKDKPYAHKMPPLREITEVNSGCQQWLPKVTDALNVYLMPHIFQIPKGIWKGLKQKGRDLSQESRGRKVLIHGYIPSTEHGALPHCVCAAWTNCSHFTLELALALSANSWASMLPVFLCFFFWICVLYPLGYHPWNLCRCTCYCSWALRDHCHPQGVWPLGVQGQAVQLPPMVATTASYGHPLYLQGSSFFFLWSSHGQPDAMVVVATNLISSHIFRKIKAKQVYCGQTSRAHCSLFLEKLPRPQQTSSNDRGRGHFGWRKGIKKKEKYHEFTICKNPLNKYGYPHFRDKETGTHLFIYF